MKFTQRKKSPVVVADDEMMLNGANASSSSSASNENNGQRRIASTYHDDENNNHFREHAGASEDGDGGHDDSDDNTGTHHRSDGHHSDRRELLAASGILPQRTTRKLTSYKEPSDDEFDSDDDDEEEEDMPKRRSNRRVRLQTSTRSKLGKEDEFVRPHSRTTRQHGGPAVSMTAHKHGGITASDFEYPTRGLRARKAVNYNLDSDEDGDDVDEMDEDDEEEERQPRRSTRQRTTRMTFDDEEEENEDEDELDDEEEEEDVDEETDEVEQAMDEADSDENDDDDDDNIDEDDDEEEPVFYRPVERIIACREIQKNKSRRLSNISSHSQQSASEEQEIMKEEGDEDDSEDDDGSGDTVEYLIKFKDSSYMHCQWMPRSIVETLEQGKQRLQRFHQKFTVESFAGMDDGDYFNQDYLEVERIVDSKIHYRKRLYLVKWKMLPYEEATWELASDVADTQKIKQFNQFKKVPTVAERRIPLRPPAKAFKKMEQSPSFKNDNQLREYQLEGLNWLVFCWYNRRNSILADEMGLGKTVQTVAMLEYLRRVQHNRGPFLIIAPLSTIPHWQREFENWSEMNAIVFHGSSRSRDMIRQYEWTYRDSRGKVVPRVYKFNVLITTYEMVMADASRLARVHWQYMVVDEGHRLKNYKSKLLEVLRGFTSEHKLLLTGTPLQNDIGELWTLLNYLDPDKFPSREDFLDEFGNMQDSSELEKLQQQIGPYLLRRLKEDVEKSIPPKEEIIVEVVLSNVQKQYYRAILDRNRDFLMQGVSSKRNIPNLMNVLMEIRKVCNHPFLIQGAEERLTKGMDRDELMEFMIKCSSKLLLVDKLFKELRANGHRVLVFSQMVQVLNILEDYLIYRNYSYCRLDGSIRGDLRQEAIDRFSDPNSDIFAFIVSTRAGGVGINLTAADTVVIFDSDWNPQNDEQAEARVHRIGQTKEVKVYRLLTKNTKEKDMFEAASRKLGLDRAILNTGDRSNTDIFSTSARADRSGKSTLDKEEINMLLRYGAYSAFKDDAEDQKLLQEGDVASILERNATVVRYDQSNVPDKGLSSFSKASFNFNEDDVNVDIDDKDFWTKILPEEKTPELLLRRLMHEESALETEEQQTEFMDDVETFVERKLHDIKRLKFDNDESLANLLTQIQYYDKFPETYRQRAKECLEMIDQPRTRGARAAGVSAKSPSLGDENDEDDEYKAEKSKMRGAPGGVLQLQKKGGWFKAERQRLQKALLELGWDRWQEIRANNKLSSHTVTDIHSFAEAMVSVMMEHTKEEEDTLFLNDLLRSSATEDHKGLTEATRKLKLQPSGIVKVCQKIRVDLPKAKDKYRDGRWILEILEFRRKSTKDAKSKKGKSKRGSGSSATNSGVIVPQGNVIIIRSREFSEKQKALDHMKIAAPGYHGEFAFRFICNSPNEDERPYICQSERFSTTGTHPQLTEEEWVHSLQRGLKNWVKKLRFAYELSRVIELYGINLDKKPAPRLAVKQLVEWWDDECDKDMLKGLYKRGYGRSDEFKDDDSLSWKRKYERYVSDHANASDDERRKAEDTWPSASTINKRVVSVIRSYLREAENSASKRKTPKASSAGGATSSSSSSRQPDITSEWTKREKTEIQRCLLYFGTFPDSQGLPQLDKIIEEATLRKTEDDTRAYLKELLRLVDLKAAGILVDDAVAVDDEEAAEEKDAMLKDKQSEEMEVEVEDESDDDDSGEDVANTKVFKRTTLPEMDDIAEKTAKKIKQRVAVMIKLHRYYYPNEGKYESRTHEIPTPGSGLPKWWNAKVHDVHLLRGVKKYAFQLSKIFTDTEYSFHNMKPSTKTGKVDALVREGLIIDRLEKIAEYCEEQETGAINDNDAKDSLSSMPIPKHGKSVQSTLNFVIGNSSSSGDSSSSSSSTGTKRKRRALSQNPKQTKLRMIRRPHRNVRGDEEQDSNDQTSKVIELNSDEKVMYGYEDHQEMLIDEIEEYSDDDNSDENKAQEQIAQDKDSDKSSPLAQHAESMSQPQSVIPTPSSSAAMDSLPSIPKLQSPPRPPSISPRNHEEHRRRSRDLTPIENSNSPSTTTSRTRSRSHDSNDRERYRDRHRDRSRSHHRDRSRSLSPGRGRYSGSREYGNNSSSTSSSSSSSSHVRDRKRDRSPDRGRERDRHRHRSRSRSPYNRHSSTYRSRSRSPRDRDRNRDREYYRSYDEPRSSKRQRTSRYDDRH